MIRLSENTILEDYFIDENGVITDINGVIQEIYLNQGRPKFKGTPIHRILMYTFYGYRKMDIHHIDGNKLNNTLSNLVYLTREEHTKLHHKDKHITKETRRKMSESQKGKHLTEEHKQKLSESLKGRHWNLSEETRRKLSESHKGKQNWSKYFHWFNDGIKNFYCKECPEGCIPGRIKKPV